MKKNLIHIWKVLQHRHKRIIFRCFLIMVFAVAGATCIFLSPVVVEQILDCGFAKRDVEKIFRWSVVFVVIGGSGACLHYFQSKEAQKMRNEIKKEVFDEIHNVFFSRREIETVFSGTEYAEMIVSDLDYLGVVIELFSEKYTIAILQMVAGVIGILLLHRGLIVILFFLIPMKAYISIFFSNKKMLFSSKKIKEKTKLMQKLDDFFRGYRELQLFETEAFSRKRLHNSWNVFLKTEEDEYELDYRREVIEEVSNFLLHAFFYIVGGGVLALEAEFSIGKVLAFISYATFTIGPLQGICDIPYMLSGCAPSIERICTFLPKINKKNEQIKRVEIKEKDQIFFDQVSFSYDSQRTIFNKISFKIKKGETIGIIGKNGEGKSTLINLLSGFYCPTQGEIYIDGILLNELSIVEIREKISVVQQKGYIFNDTIQWNLDMLGKHTDFEIKEICKKIGFDSIIMRGEHGLMELVGNDGIRLSGGERQKMLIARGVLKDSDIYIFDEPMKGLDEISRGRFFDYVNTQLKNKTVILISHEMEDLKTVDRIIHVKDKTVI